MNDASSVTIDVRRTIVPRIFAVQLCREDSRTTRHDRETVGAGDGM